MIDSSYRHLLILSVILILTGLSLFTYRALYLHVPLQPSVETDTWLVEANLKFTAGAKAIKAELTIPSNPPNFSMLDETFLSRNYGVNFVSEDTKRKVIWSIRRAQGAQLLYYRAIFFPEEEAKSTLKKPKVLVKADFSETNLSAAETIVENVREKSADIATFAAETLKILNNQEDNDAAIILSRDYSPETVTKVATEILALANIYSKYIQGIYLTSQKNAKLHPWLAVYNGKQWVYFNPSTGKRGLPENFLVWQYDDKEVMNVVGGSKPQLTITVEKSPVNALELAQKRNEDSELMKLSLFGLPLKTQQVYKILMTVPIGAFIILLLRNYVGLLTFGTFMPVLIALAFRETKLISGILLFSLITAIGLLVRFYLDQLRLLLVPRLTAILIMVVLIMMMITIFSQRLGFVTGLSIALFPMVIITMTIERMCILWDERGAHEAIMAGVGSMVAASLAYLVMRINALEYLFFAFPELLLILLGLTLLMGQYRGYRLSELKRFKAFLKSS